MTPPDQTGPAVQPMPEGQAGPGAPAQIGQPTNDPAATQPHVPNEDLNTEAVHSGEIAQQIKPDRWEQMRGFLKHGVEAGLGRAEEWASEQDQKIYDRFSGQPKITAEQANKLFPNMPQAFSEPIDPLVAQMQWNYSHRMQKIQEWNSAGGPAPWTEFGANLVTGFVDPINVAASFLTGGASKVLGITSSLRNTVLENLATNIALVPVERQLVGEMHLPKASSDEELKSVITGTLVGSGIHMVMGHLFKSELDRVKNLPADVRERALREVIAQNEVGSRPDATRAESEGAIRARGEMEGQGSQARFNPIQNASEAPHYAAKDAAGKNLNPSGQELGSGTVAVRDGAKANHLAANPGGDSGRVGVYEIPKEAKLLDLEQPITSESGKAFIDALEKDLGFKISSPGDSVLDVMASLPNPAERERAQNIAKSLGYEGYQVLNGEKPENGYVHLFDENAQPHDSVEANSEIVPRSSEEAKKQAFLESTSPETKKTYTPELAQEIHAFHKGPPLNAEFTPDYMDPIVKEQFDSAKAQLDTWAKDDPKLQEEIKEVFGHGAAVDKQESQVAKDLINCLSEGMS